MSAIRDIATKAYYRAERIFRRESITSARAFLSEAVDTIPATLGALTEKKQGLARFGDGEFYLMLRPNYDLPFQKNSPQLRQELFEALECQSDILNVCIPGVDETSTFWTHFWAREWRQMEPTLRSRSSFGNSMVSRPEAFRDDPHNTIAQWRRVWDEKSVAIVTGHNSRFDLVPELFSAVAQVERIPSVNSGAYEDLDRIEGLVSQSRADLILIALGPAGTVLASRLARAGRRALDIGHLSNSFKHYALGAPQPELQRPVHLTRNANRP